MAPPPTGDGSRNQQGSANDQEYLGMDATHCQGCSSQFTFINRKIIITLFGGKGNRDLNQVVCKMGQVLRLLVFALQPSLVHAACRLLVLANFVSEKTKIILEDYNEIVGDPKIMTRLLKALKNSKGSTSGNADDTDEGEE